MMCVWNGGFRNLPNNILNCVCSRVCVCLIFRVFFSERRFEIISLLYIMQSFACVYATRYESSPVQYRAVRHMRMPTRNTYNAIFSYLFSLQFRFEFISSNENAKEEKRKEEKTKLLANRQSGFTVNFYDHIAFEWRMKKKKIARAHSSVHFACKWIQNVSKISSKFKRHMLWYGTFGVSHLLSSLRRAFVAVAISVACTH